MSDIFISYKKEDAGRVVRIVEALRAEGFSVWWDHGIAPGAQWDKTIQTQLDAAKAVVAVWSQQSRDAPWVKEESAVGKSRGILVPIRIDDVEPPLGFTLIQAVDLIGWSGDVKDQRWQRFTAGLKAVLSGERTAAVEAPLRSRPTLPGWIWGLVGVALLSLVAAGWWAVTKPPPTDMAQTPPSASSSPSANLPQAPASVGAAPTAVAGAPAGPQEQAMFNTAMQQKTRAAWQSFLAAYPNGANAQRARDMLLMCRTEAREAWVQPATASNQAVRGVGTMPEQGATQAQACQAAKSMARKQAQANCEGIAGNPGYRNPQWTVRETDCTCTQTSPAATVCVVDMPATCTWEQKTMQQAEVCG